MGKIGNCCKSFKNFWCLENCGRLIAFFTIVASFFYFFQLFRIWYSNEIIPEDCKKNINCNQGIMIAGYVLMLFASVTGFIMGIFLAKGINDENHSLILPFLTMLSISLASFLILGVTLFNTVILEHLTVSIILFFFGVFSIIILFFLYDRFKNSKETKEIESIEEK